MYNYDELLSKLESGCRVYLTADDEEPKCVNCDNQDTNVCERCGGEYCWNGYCRSIKSIDEL